jgi:hypothetical protein
MIASQGGRPLDSDDVAVALLPLTARSILTFALDEKCQSGMGGGPVADGFLS